MDNQVRTLAYAVAEVLQQYIERHDDMLGRTFLAFLKPINFASNADELTRIGSRLEILRSEAVVLNASPAAQPRHHGYLNVMISYIEALAATIALLRSLATQLRSKADGRGYSAGEYRDDLAKYRLGVDRYRHVGQALKTAWLQAQL